jgi:sialic acid synthase SpsE
MTGAFARELPPALRPGTYADAGAEPNGTGPGGTGAPPDTGASEERAPGAARGQASGAEAPPYRIAVVAEVGTSHGGELTHAFELIDAAAEAGADCVKAQIVYADEIVHPNTGSVDLPSGSVPLYDRFKDAEVSPEFYARMAERCAERGLLFVGTAFGVQSARELAELQPAAFKVASPELNHFPLLRELAAHARPIVLSTGVARLGDIERALDTVERAERVLLHCITAYPAPEEQYNLRTIDTLSRVFGVPVGVSDHTTDPELVPSLAATCGAVMIEKHFTLSNRGAGLDDPIALEPEPFTRMCATVRRTEEILRIGGEQAPARVQEELGKSYSEERVRAVLGDGVKRLAPSEARYYGRTNRSIHARSDIRAGHTLTAQDLAVLRTESNLRPGLDPVWLDTLLGATARRSIDAGQGVTLEDLLSR